MREYRENINEKMTNRYDRYPEDIFWKLAFKELFY